MDSNGRFDPFKSGTKRFEIFFLSFFFFSYSSIKRLTFYRENKFSYVLISILYIIQILIRKEKKKELISKKN